MALFKTKIMSKSRACRPMASKDGLQFVKPLRIPWLLLFHSTLCGWTAEREQADLGRGWEGVPGLYCTHCERAAFWINGDLQHHQHALIVS